MDKQCLWRYRATRRRRSGTFAHFTLRRRHGCGRDTCRLCHQHRHHCCLGNCKNSVRVTLRHIGFTLVVLNEGYFLSDVWMRTTRIVQQFSISRNLRSTTLCHRVKSQSRGDRLTSCQRLVLKKFQAWCAFGTYSTHPQSIAGFTTST